MPELTPAPLDDVSKAIIEQLQEDGRRSYSAIGKAVGLSEAAVRQRVQKLTEAGVMQIVAVTDPVQVGFNRQAMIGIKCTGDSYELADALSALGAVDYVVLTAGSFDIVVEVVSRTTNTCCRSSTSRSERCPVSPAQRRWFTSNS